MAFACPTSSWKSCENSMCIISTRFDFIVLVSSFRARNSTPCDFVAKYIWKKNTNIHTDYSATGETPIFPSYAVVLAAEDIGYSQADLVERANRLLPSWGVDISDCPFRKIHWGTRQLWLAGKNMAQDKLFKLHQLSSAVANQTEIWTRIKWHSFEPMTLFCYVYTMW